MIDIDYNSLTKEKLEQYVEFIDWYQVPLEIIDEEIIEKFSFFDSAQKVIHFKTLYEKMHKRKVGVYPNTVHYFIEDDWYMDYNYDTNFLSFSYERFWGCFPESNSNNSYYSTIGFFMRDVMQRELEVDNLKLNILHGIQFCKIIEEKFRDYVNT